MPNLLLPLLLTAMVLLVAGCSSSAPTADSGNTPSDGSNQNTGTQTPHDAPTTGNNQSDLPAMAESLYGTWVSDCSNDGEGSAYRLSKWSFASTEVTGITYAYASDDPECAAPTGSTSRTFEPTYLADTQETTLGAAIKTDLIVIASVITEGTQVVWDSGIDGIPPDVTNEYNIFLVSDNRLYGGSLDSGNANTPLTRPTAINSQFGLIRQ
ncbi:MAG: hypothetical protein AAF404_11380 [Pseudomonadota bacterium]